MRGAQVSARVLVKDWKILPRDWTRILKREYPSNHLRAKYKPPSNILRTFCKLQISKIKIKWLFLSSPFYSDWNIISLPGSLGHKFAQNVWLQRWNVFDSSIWHTLWCPLTCLRCLFRRLRHNEQTLGKLSWNSFHRILKIRLKPCLYIFSIWNWAPMLEESKRWKLERDWRQTISLNWI